MPTSLYAWENSRQMREALADRNSLGCKLKNEESSEKTCKRKCCLGNVLMMRTNLIYYNVFREVVEETSLLELNLTLPLTWAFFWAFQNSPHTEMLVVHRRLCRASVCGGAWLLWAILMNQTLS